MSLKERVSQIKENLTKVSEGAEVSSALCLFRGEQNGWRECEGCAAKGNKVKLRTFECFLHKDPVSLTECDSCLDKRQTVHKPISNLDMSLSDYCNLRCPFCYICRTSPDKLAKANAERSLKIIRWFMNQARPLPPKTQRKVSIFGGEPLFEWDNLQEVVTRAKEEWKNDPLHIGIVTNITLLTEERYAWLKEKGITFQMSIDGAPIVQDKQRVRADGSGTSKVATEVAKMVLRDRPQTGIRATTTPFAARHLYESVRYFHEELGCEKIIPVHASGYIWTPDDLAVYEEQLYLIADYIIDKLRNGKFIYMFPFNRGCRGFTSQSWGGTNGCGAGRSMICVDANYNIWPCHRFYGGDPSSPYLLGNILQGGISNRVFYDALNSGDCRAIRKEECKKCPAQITCQGMCMWETMYHGPNGVCYMYPQGKNDHMCELTRIYQKVWMYIHTRMESGDANSRELYRVRLLGKKVQKQGNRTASSKNRTNQANLQAKTCRCSEKGTGNEHKSGVGSDCKGQGCAK